MPYGTTQDGWSHSGEFWQNMIHWKREWQTTLVHLPWVHHELYKKATEIYVQKIDQIQGEFF